LTLPPAVRVHFVGVRGQRLLDRLGHHSESAENRGYWGWCRLRETHEAQQQSLQIKGLANVLMAKVQHNCEIKM